MSEKVFFSWSGDMSKEIAKEFKKLFDLTFSLVIDSFMSEVDISPGERSISTISSALEECNYGIAFVCKDNVRAPWINFEAGALAKAVSKGKVFVLLLDNDASSLAGTPLAEFQYKHFNKEEVWEILERIASLAGSKNAVEIYKTHYLEHWNKFEEKAHETITKYEQMPGQKEPEDDAILNMLVSIKNTLDLRYIDNVKTSVAELKKMIQFMSPKDLDSLKLRFKVNQYENIFSKNVDMLNGMIDKLENRKSDADKDLISETIKQLEGIVEQTLALGGE